MTAQRGGQGGKQLVGGELRLGLVVVDVVVDDDATLGCLPGLAGAQDDAHRLVLELVADELDELEPRGVGLHDDVEQHRGYVRMLAHELAALRRRVGGDDLQPLAVELVVAERKSGAVVHGRLVVDHRDLPAPAFRGCRLVTGIVDQVDDVVVSHAPCPSLVWPAAPAFRRAPRAEW